MQLFEYEDLDKLLCQQLRLRLSATPYSTARVSTELKTEPFPPGGQIWITNLGGVTTGWGEQDIDYQVRCIAPTYDAAKGLTKTIRSLLDEPDSMYYLLDNTTKNVPIYNSVSDWSTSTPAPTQLFENQYTYFFTLSLHQAANPTT